MDPEKKKRLQQTIGNINKKFGKDTVQTAQEAYSQGKLTKKRVKTPSLEFNDMLHGGFAGIVELFGSTGSGKTSLAIETIAHNQQNDPDFVAAWLETEGSVTEEILYNHGIDMERLIYWRQEDVGTAESALDIARGFIAAGDVDLMVFNSVAGLAPKTETEDDLEKQNIALTARLLSKFFRVITGQASKNDVTMLFINQVRDNVGVMFGNPTTTPGGKALGFYASQRIMMNKVKIQASDPIKEEDGLKVSCITYKNRFAGRHNPYTKCHYYATYANGIDSIIAIPDLLLEANIVRKAGAWWYYEDAQGNPISFNGVPCKWRSQTAFIDALRSDEALRDMLISKLDAISQNQNATEMAAVKQAEQELEEEQREAERIEEGMEIQQALFGETGDMG